MPSGPVTTAERQAFVQRFMPHAQKWSAQTGIPAEVYLAILASESNYGRAESFFGIKGGGDAGTVAYRTHEVRPDGTVEYITDNFARYSSPDAGHQAFINLISQGRYAKAWENYRQTGDWQQLLDGINQAGYATDPNWSKSIASIAQQFGDVKATPAAKGPNGRTFAEIQGTEYLSEAERNWYKAVERGDLEAAQSLAGGDQPQSVEGLLASIGAGLGWGTGQQQQPSTDLAPSTTGGGGMNTQLDAIAEMVTGVPGTTWASLQGADLVAGQLLAKKMGVDTQVQQAVTEGRATRQELETAGATFGPGYADAGGVRYLLQPDGSYAYQGNAPQPSASELRDQQAAEAARQQQETYRAQIAAVANNQSGVPIKDQHGQNLSLSRDPAGNPTGQLTATTTEGAAQLGTPGISRPGNGDGRPQRIAVLDDYARAKAGMSFQELAQRDATAAYRLKQEWLAQDNFTEQDVADVEYAQGLLQEQQAAEEKRRRAQMDADAYYQQKLNQPRYQAQGALNVAGKASLSGTVQLPNAMQPVGQSAQFNFAEQEPRPVEATPIRLNNDYTGTPPPDMSAVRRLAEYYDSIRPGTGWMVYQRFNGRLHRYGGHTYRFEDGDWVLADPEGYDAAKVEQQNMQAFRGGAEGNRLATADTTALSATQPVSLPRPPAATPPPETPTLPTLPEPEEPYRPPQVMAGGGYGQAGVWMPKIMYAKGGGFMTGNPIGMFELSPDLSRIVNPVPRAIAGEDANGDGVPEQEAIAVVNQQQMAGQQPLAPGVGDILRGVRPNMQLAQQYAMDPALMQIAAAQLKRVKYRPAVAA